MNGEVGGGGGGGGGGGAYAANYRVGSFVCRHFIMLQLTSVEPFLPVLKLNGKPPWKDRPQAFGPSSHTNYVNSPAFSMMQCS